MGKKNCNRLFFALKLNLSYGVEFRIESMSVLILYIARRNSGNQLTIFVAISFDVPVKSFQI